MKTVAIYDKPLDYPDEYVARLFVWDKPTDILFHDKSLAAVRDWAINRLHVYGIGAVRMPRSKRDHPNVVEVWI